MFLDETFLKTFIGSLALALALAAGFIAHSKGRSFIGYFLLGLVLPFVGVVIAAGVGSKRDPEQEQLDRGEAIRCRYCAELVRPEATVCKHCGRDLPTSAPVITASGLDLTGIRLDDPARR